jgi:hypothetical protein
MLRHMAAFMLMVRRVRGAAEDRGTVVASIMGLVTAI